MAIGYSDDREQIVQIKLGKENPIQSELFGLQNKHNYRNTNKCDPLCLGYWELLNVNEVPDFSLCVPAWSSASLQEAVRISQDSSAIFRTRDDCC